MLVDVSWTVVWSDVWHLVKVFKTKAWINILKISLMHFELLNASQRLIQSAADTRCVSISNYHVFPRVVMRKQMELNEAEQLNFKFC